jgi:hypothetical protein
VPCIPVSLAQFGTALAKIYYNLIGKNAESDHVYQQRFDSKKITLFNVAC